MKTMQHDDSRLLVKDYAPLESTVARDAAEWEQSYARLHSWTCALLNSVRSSYAELQETMESNKPLPQGCPSRGSAAALVFRQVEKKLGEVQATYADVEKGIWKADK
jgi:hypothetical protein